ncbi:MAG: type II toxin-antitoxin system VapC family toxin [Fibromonadales bacterium]|nr:type II toxin-antitoxin system VapC family toxin [Fibromonadales bacterium]
MKYLIDTNVLSEMTKQSPNKEVVKWFVNTPDMDMFISVISIGEIIYGIERLPISTRKSKLFAWFNEVISEGFNERILDIKASTMQTWGQMMARHSRSLQVQDTFIAATALENNLTIATRNVKDFSDIAGLQISNPWEK